jgi:pimeloyl-ACP methyl ester carboxylesterase
MSVAFPGGTPRLAVFLHGLGGTEDTWLFAARRHYDDPAMCFGSKLSDEFGYTALYVRYHTGLHVSENGGLLGAVVANRPMAVEEIALIGHSMGGLIARRGCHGGQQAGASWVPAVRHVVCLGSPHLGARVEKNVAVLSRALAGVAETRPFAFLLSERSAGIKDLRRGYLTEDGWRDCDPDSCGVDYRRPIELLPNVSHYVVAATVTRDPSHPIGRVVGDVLVQPASAHGVSTDGRHIPFPIENRRHFGGLHHRHAPLAGTVASSSVKRGRVGR